jgi:hypothetical protein
MKEALKRIADSLEKIAQPVELTEVAQEMPEPVCPACQAKDPQVLITAEQVSTPKLSEAMSFSLILVCMECKAHMELEPTGLQLKVAE